MVLNEESLQTSVLEDSSKSNNDVLISKFDIALLANVMSKSRSYNQKVVKDWLNQNISNKFGKMICFVALK